MSLLIISTVFISIAKYLALKHIAYRIFQRLPLCNSSYDAAKKRRHCINRRALFYAHVNQM